ncbi:hypothetical protein [Geothrix sp. 21YS21S-4]|uniref:hypothetical protein n=1 Tax=Geothrix sp. 21YS21S-4 TaxID=3068889 RepID=UPI0027B91118|nr:hypothetical protein [Geothrix sp. 21YS21S-4]
MDLPEHLHHLVSELGDSLVKALAEDDHCRDLAFQIQAQGYGLMLILEAAPIGARPEEGDEPVESASSLPFSEDDKRLMKSFKIRMD